MTMLDPVNVVFIGAALVIGVFGLALWLDNTVLPALKRKRKELQAKLRELERDDYEG